MNETALAAAGAGMKGIVVHTVDRASGTIVGSYGPAASLILGARWTERVWGIFDSGLLEFGFQSHKPRGKTFLR